MGGGTAIGISRLGDKGVEGRNWGGISEMKMRKNIRVRNE